MKRTIAIFAAGMLTGGSMMHLFRTAQSIDHIDSRAGTDAESAAVPVRDTDAAPTNAADDSAATASADRDALAALDEALAIGNARDRQQAIGRAIEHLDALPALDRAQLARPFAARFTAAALIDSRALWSQRPTIDRVIDGWFYYDPGAASAWAAGIPERLARQAALTFVGNSWARLDSDSAMSFVAGLWDRFEAALAP